MMVSNLPDSYAILLKMNTSLPETLSKRLANLALICYASKTILDND